MKEINKCKYCNRGYASGMLKKHELPCGIVFNNKDYIFKTYGNEINNLDILAKKIGVGRAILRHWIDVWDIKVNSINGKFGRVFSLNDDFFDDMKEEQYWLLGMMASDGSVRDSKYITISQSGVEGLQMIEYIKNILEFNGNININKTNRKDSYRLLFTSEKIASKLNEWNISPGKSYNYKIPEDKIIDSRYLKSFIRGYVDGDGSIGFYKNNVGYEFLILSFVGTFEFMNQMKNIMPVEPKFNKLTDNTFELRWNGRNAVEMCQWLYEDNYLFKSKKYILFSDYMESYNPKYVKYNKIKEDVRNMLLEGIRVQLISEKCGVRFQTIYKWKKEWEL